MFYTFLIDENFNYKLLKKSSTKLPEKKIQLLIYDNFMSDMKYEEWLPSILIKKLKNGEAVSINEAQYLNGCVLSYLNTIKHKKSRISQEYGIGVYCENVKNLSKLTKDKIEGKVNNKSSSKNTKTTKKSTKKIEDVEVSDEEDNSSESEFDSDISLSDSEESEYDSDDESD